ncbi:MAG: hydrolase [Myxococcaceae bacterium]|nr:hydrolase [Myxococcaceae bacterium]
MRRLVLLVPVEPKIQAVGAIVWRAADDAVLLVRRANPPLAGRWTLPGGKVEPGETPAEAIVREVREETGLAVSVVRHLERVELGAFVIDEIECALDASAHDAEPRAGDDASDVRWAELDELAALDVNAEAVRVLERAAALRGVGRG